MTSIDTITTNPISPIDALRYIQNILWGRSNLTDTDRYILKLIETVLNEGK